MIPKIIHYCWFGSQDKPVYAVECIETWRQYFPDFEIIEWNESNTSFDHPFVRRAYNEKKWAFVSDFIRIQKLNEHGGIYLDTDMYFLKKLPAGFLDQHAFLGAENKQSLSAGIIGSVPGSEFIRPIFAFYSGLSDEKFEDVLIPKVLNKTVKGVVRPIEKSQQMAGTLVLAAPVFYPLPFKLKKFHWNKFVTKDTIAVHLWAGSWLTAPGSSAIKQNIARVKYFISKWYVPQSFLDYARSH